MKHDTKREEFRIGNLYFTRTGLCDMHATALQNHLDDAVESYAEKRVEEERRQTIATIEKLKKEKGVDCWWDDVADDIMSELEK